MKAGYQRAPGIGHVPGRFASKLAPTISARVLAGFGDRSHKPLGLGHAALIRVDADFVTYLQIAEVGDGLARSQDRLGWVIGSEWRSTAAGRHRSHPVALASLYKAIQRTECFGLQLVESHM